MYNSLLSCYEAAEQWSFLNYYFTICDKYFSGSVLTLSFIYI